MDRKKGRGRTVKPSVNLTGKSNAIWDNRYEALAPGRRRSASGKTYYEYRKNRADL